METQTKLTKLAQCAGCGAKVGAGTLAKLLDGFKTITDPKLIVGFDKSDDASVYVVSPDLAVVQTVDFFPPIVDDPFLFGKIAAANAISDIYAMGATPKLALNIMTVAKGMTKSDIREVLRGGYEKAYEAGVIISGGHTIEDTEPKYGLAVAGFVHPGKVLTNSTARPGDVIILTKPLGVGIITTAAKAGFLDAASPSGMELMKRIWTQMETLNKSSAESLAGFEVHSLTDVTGFGLMGHLLEMAEGSGLKACVEMSGIKYHPEALEYAQMGMVPAGAYRNRDFCQGKVTFGPTITQPQQDILFDPQTSGGLMIAVSPKDAQALYARLSSILPGVSIVGTFESVVKGERAGIEVC